MTLALEQLYVVHDHNPPVTLERLVLHADLVYGTPLWALPQWPPTLQMHASRLLFALDDDTDVVCAHAQAFAAQVLVASRNVYGGKDKQTNGRARDITEAARKQREERATLADLKARAKGATRPAPPTMPLLLEVSA